jgi:mxaL protein
MTWHRRLSSKAVRVWLWLTALGLLTATLFKPVWVLPQSLPRYLMVVDITQSMNARDYHLPGLPPDRLSFAKAAMEAAILALPCGSEVGLGIFTHKHTQLLLEPIEVCHHAPALRAALKGIDWRSAWAADSYIAYGVFDALRIALNLQADLVFITDGDQIPETARDPLFFASPGLVGGWLVGVGTPRPVPIPKFDPDGQMIGYWQTTDLPRPAQSARYQTRMPLEEPALLLSRLDATRLHRLAEVTGLTYLTLNTPQQLTDAVRQSRPGRLRPIAMDLRPWLGLGALLAAIVAILV